jgi:hypothetical protein
MHEQPAAEANRATSRNVSVVVDDSAEDRAVITQADGRCVSAAVS